MKSFTVFFIILISFFFIQDIYTQGLTKDDSYNFKITLPSDWTKTKTEETDKKDAISYSFEKRDGKNVIMLLAFRLENVKNLEDFVYTLEKDLTLNIPKRDDDYVDFEFGSYDGRWTVYKDSEFIETIYYYRTKNSDSDENYAYMLRFITAGSYHNSTVEKQIEDIAKTFTPIL
jgi:hypothetical protein